MKRRDLLALAAASAVGLLLPKGLLAKGRRLWAISRPGAAAPGPSVTGGSAWGPETEGHRLAIRMLSKNQVGNHFRIRREGEIPEVARLNADGMWEREPLGPPAPWEQVCGIDRARQAATAAARADPDFDRETLAMIDRLREQPCFRGLPRPALDEVRRLDLNNYGDYLAQGPVPVTNPLAPTWVPLAAGGKVRLT